MSAPRCSSMSAAMAMVLPGVIWRRQFRSSRIRSLDRLMSRNRPRSTKGTPLNCSWTNTQKTYIAAVSVAIATRMTSPHIILTLKLLKNSYGSTRGRPPTASRNVMLNLASNAGSSSWVGCAYCESSELESDVSRRLWHSDESELHGSQ
jgi:hypothetical protein